MELRHLRYFIAVAEELHFAHAAERLHIEQSPLSRAIKDLEHDLEARLFERTTRSTRLTWAGEVFLAESRRVLSTLEQAKARVKAAANGFRGTLRIALSDGVATSRLARLLALCREEEPEVEIRLFEISLAQQLKGLRGDLYDAGFAKSPDVGEGIIAEAVWSDPLVVAMPTRHPLLVHKSVRVEQILQYPLVLCHPEVCEGTNRQIDRLLRTVSDEPIVAERVSSHELLLTLVAAGYGLGLTSAIRIDSGQHPDIVARPLTERSFVLTTYFLRPDIEPSEQLSHFIDRVQPLESSVPDEAA
jgi:DNA-binding transcriptional LysR family regulator